MANLTMYLIYVIAWLISFSIETLILTNAVKKKNRAVNVAKLAAIAQSIPDYCAEAEKMFPSTDTTKYGWAKLSYVLNKLHADCIENGVVFNEIAMKGEIEAILSAPQKKESIDEKNS